MNPEPTSQALEGNMAGRVMGQEFEDLAIVVAQIVEGLPRNGVHRGRNHAERAQGGGSA
jgi:predicted phosphoribosyltransferase